jgi:hypothetical protein
MSLEKLAEVLYVDAVKINHGPKGVAVHVCVDGLWKSTTIDNEALEGRRLEVIAERLLHLADGNVHKVRQALRKGYVVEGATRAAVEADRIASVRRSERLSRNDVPFSRPYDGPIQQQVTKSEIAPASPPPPAVPEAEPVEQMPSRFHAVMAELRCL